MDDWKRKPDSYWKEHLSPEQFEIARRAGTERAFTGEYWDCKKDGTYLCVCCGTPLFDSQHKYDSGSGWPSFYEAIDREKFEVKEDHKLASPRLEIVCKTCGAHLGHVFDDGPKPTGLRYCMNSAALKLKERSKK